MEVMYLHHSGFAVLLDGVTLIFDAITDVPKEILDRPGPKFFLVSHVHHDHFNSGIFKYDSPETTYILSDDIRITKNAPNITFIKPYTSVHKGDVYVEAFGSTDQGISMVVKYKEKVIYFAGDLNWWAWSKSERPLIDPEAEERDYKNEIAKIKKALGDEKVDIAFVPVDSRFSEMKRTLLAADYFIKEIEPEYLFPMHFWEEFGVIKALRDSLPSNCKTIIPEFDRKNQLIKLK